jgi:hypothetical protein
MMLIRMKSSAANFSASRLSLNSLRCKLFPQSRFSLFRVESERNEDLLRLTVLKFEPYANTALEGIECSVRQKNCLSFSNPSHVSPARSLPGFFRLFLIDFCVTIWRAFEIDTLCNNRLQTTIISRLFVILNIHEHKGTKEWKNS